MPATQSQSGVTKSPYEPGVYFVRGQTWQVIRVSSVLKTPSQWTQSDFQQRIRLQIGDRYELLKQLGTGSFSEVCLATDRSTGDKVHSSRLLLRLLDILLSLASYTKSAWLRLLVISGQVQQHSTGSVVNNC